MKQDFYIHVTPPTLKFFILHDLLNLLQWTLIHKICKNINFSITLCSNTNVQYFLHIIRLQLQHQA